MLDQFVLMLEPDGKAKLNATTYSSKGKSKFTYSWSSTDPSVATVSAEGVVTALSAGVANIVVKADKDPGISAACHVMVLTFVDLGGTVLWATCNFGAADASEPGRYHAWGERGTKNTYLWSNYQYGSGEKKLTKYNWDEQFGRKDDKTSLDVSDDVVAVMSDHRFRMPSKSELSSLLSDESLAREYVNDGGRKGLRIWKESTGAQIFLPAGGYYDGTVREAEDMGYYWTSDLSPLEYDPGYAVGLYFDDQTVVQNAFTRCWGLSIRPVKPI